MTLREPDAECCDRDEPRRPGGAKADLGGRILLLFLSAAFFLLADVCGDQLARALLTARRRHLPEQFDRWLARPRRYKELVDSECRDYFPEGDLFPYVFPVYAYTNLALQDPSVRPNAVRNVTALIDMALSDAVKKMPPQENLWANDGWGRFPSV